MDVAVHSPGRVNLIGDHIDYLGGPVLPMAIDLGVTITGSRGGGTVRLSSDIEEKTVDIPIDLDDATSAPRGWGRYVAGAVCEFRPDQGFEGTISSNLPAGAGLSSSAALTVAVALAVGVAEADPGRLARRCQRAEQASSGVPCGVMDQVAIVAGRSGHALRIDCEEPSWVSVAMPEDIEVLIVHSGEERRLSDGAYRRLRREIETAAALVGPAPEASPADWSRLTDDRLQRRARHVVTEWARVDEVVDAFRSGDIAGAGAVMTASHGSLARDAGCSTPSIDALVDHLVSVDGVHGARLTGAGFGGCVVALVRRGVRPDVGGLRTWTVVASDGAHVVT